MNSPGAPKATYRLQLHSGFTLHDAAALADYLAQLGLSHVYLSPILKAAHGSSHGYDGVDPTQFDRARGGREGFDALALACERATLGIVLDIVPNHLAVSSAESAWWQDVLRQGPASPLAAYFDIDWEAGGGAVVLPVLGESLEEVVRRGGFAVERCDDGWQLHYHDKLLPISPATDESLLREAPHSTAAMMQLLEQQHYRLCHWRDESQLNYRRFFDIASLAGVRVERPEVFDAVHALVLELVQRGRVSGLRVDHPDGLRDPRGYLARLKEQTGGAWIVAEKILAADELLRDDWPIAGTTGYDFLNEVLGVLIDPGAEDAMAELYAELIGGSTCFDDVMFEAGVEISHRLFGAELRRLSAIVERIAARDRRLAHSPDVLEEAIAVLAACMPVYRTYIAPERGEIAEEDVVVVQRTIVKTKSRRGDVPVELIDAIADLLLVPMREPGEVVTTSDEEEFVARFQQFTAPVTAKGEEDTAFYRYNRFVGLNEVGGDPSRFGRSVEAFHTAMIRRSERWPASMLTTSTHDTKRSEDVRARLAVLAEMPAAWAHAAREWMQRHEPLRSQGACTIDADTAYMLQQNLVGAWPISADRMVAFAHKAAREAKRRTSWREPDEAYEAALEAFVRALLADEAFLQSVSAFVDRIRTPGRIKSLAQTLLRCVCPGVPDLYQGCELWDLSLVDPDNRRPVDFALRVKLLDALPSMASQSVWAALDDADDPGLPKLYTIATALDVRATVPEAFGPGSGYEPLRITGRHANRALALARTDPRGRPRACAVVPVRTTAPGAWGDTAVEMPMQSDAGSSRWHNRLTGDDVAGGSVRLADLFAVAPIALLTGIETSEGIEASRDQGTEQRGERSEASSVIPAQARIHERKSVLEADVPRAPVDARLRGHDEPPLDASMPYASCLSSPSGAPS